MSTRHILLCLALSLLGAGLQAQNELPQVFSPNAAELGKYGKIPVSYFNGLPNISIPLTELKAKGYTLPVYLSYHAGGNKPDQHPGWVGLGWSLHAGGCINRIVNGMKDEMSKEEFADIYYVQPSHHPGYYYHAETTQQKDWASSQVHSDSLGYSQYFDWDPDEFQVCLDDFQASFYFIGKGDIRIVSKSAVDFKVEVHLVNGPINPVIIYPGPDTASNIGRAKRYSYFDRITLISSDGTKYVFGDDDSAIEYSMPISPNWEVIQNNIVNSQWICRATASTWHLNRIERPDGEVIFFSYTKDGTPIVRHDVHYFEECLYQFDSQEYPQAEYTYDTNDYPSQLRNISFCLIQPSYLQKITCRQSPDSLVFSRAQTNELKYATTLQEFEKKAGHYDYSDATGTYYSYAQISANDYYMQLSGISGPKRDIRFSYSSDTTRRLTLEQVAFFNGSTSDYQYSFDYDSERLPVYHARQSDLWGFYNGISYADISFRQMAQVRNQVNPAKAQAEILTAIHYPTGGRTEFEYECHTYSKEVAPITIGLLTHDTNTSAGGLRIRAIKDYSAVGPMEERVFNYNGPSGLSSGILAGSPILYVSGHYTQTINLEDLPYNGSSTWILQGTYLIGNEYPIRPLSTTDGNHVTYSQVKETASDGCHSVYRYSNHDILACCDSLPLWRKENTDSLLHFNAFNSKELFRGLLLQKTDYDKGGRMIRDELNEYNVNTSDFIKSMNVEKACGGVLACFAYRAIYTSFPYLKKKTVNNNPDIGNIPYSEVTDYTYDSHRRLTKTARVVGGTTERETFTYTGDYSGNVYSGMADRNMISLPVEHLRFRKNAPQQAEKVVAAELTTWSEGTGGLFVPSAKYVADVGAGVAPSQFTLYSVGNGGTAGYPDPEVAFTRTDRLGNILESVSRDSLYSTYLWDKKGVQPEMVAKNSRNTFRIDTVLVNHTDDGIIDYVDSPGPTTVMATLSMPQSGTLTLDLGTSDGQDWGITLSITGVGTVKLGSHGIEGNAVNSLPGYANAPSHVVFPLSAGTHSVYVLEAVSQIAAGGEQEENPDLEYTLSWTTVTITPTGCDEVFHEDFEPAVAPPGAAKEGFHSYGFHSGGNYTFELVTDPDKRYILDYRLKHSGGAWQYIRGELAHSPNGSHTIMVAYNTDKIDEVRVFPADSEVESYTWDDAGDLLSRTDSRGVTESYRYDGLGRLVGVYDNEENKVEGYEYNYKNR